MGGVKEGTDARYIHGMRVASRRLRSTLPLFSFCFPRKKYQRWIRQIRAIARALGNARDTDVQIAFLESYQKKPHLRKKVDDGINYLSEMLREQRKQQQADVLSALASLEESRTIAELSASLQMNRDGEKDGQGGAKIPALYRMAADQIGGVLGDLLSYDDVVKNPDDASGHHKVRIAAKKVRYTLEVYRPLYPDQLKSAIKNLKRLQELLGELHDCDVWAYIVARAIRVHHRPRPGTGDRSASGNPVEPVLVRILLDRKAQRDITYRELRTAWKMCDTGGIWRHLRTEVDTAAKKTPKKRISQVQLQTRRSLAPVRALMASFPEGEGHAEQVTMLALKLFDELTPFHLYSGKERFLLECAGLLHDIGWVFGQKGHHTESYRMIMDARTLPLTERERSIIALVARYHRKTAPTMDHRVYAALKGKDRRTVGALAALLRVADGLDYTHSNRISGLACTITPGDVICRVGGNGDSGVEIRRAIQKSDLFFKVFGRKLSIGQ
jgi:CHAD domain-containing protein